MKQLIIFSEYVQNKRNVKERLTSILDHFVNVNALDEKGVPTIKSQNLTIDSYKHEDDFGGDNFDEMVYVAMGDIANPIHIREKDGNKEEKLKYVVTEIKYDKKLFQPGELTIKMSITPNLKEKLTNKDYIQYTKETFLNTGEPNAKPTEISVVGVVNKTEYRIDQNKTINEYNMTNIAVRYMVFSFNMSIVDSTRYVTLQCYSPDKVLELSKYSKVYSGLQFGKQILKGEMISRFNFNESQIDCDAERLRNLSMTDYTAQKERELVQPYLVQYNESFYDFVKRVAVRCGEFLYYRNGKLCLGLPSDIKPKKLSGNLIYTYPDVNICSDMALSIKNFSSDYTVIPNDEDDGGSDSLDEWKKSYKAKLEKEKEVFYVPDYVDDEQQHIVKKETDYVASRAHWIEALAYQTMGNVLSKSKGIADIVGGFVPAATEVAQRLITKTSSEKHFDSLETVYPDEMGINRTDWEYTEGAKAMSKYVIEDTTHKKFLNQFYYEIEQGELAAERCKVEVNYSNEMPELDLTDAVDLDDGMAAYYIVSRMHGYFINDKNGNVTHKQHTVEVVPTLNKKLEPAAEDDGNIVLLPPHCGIPHILKASAQEAEVIETEDPLQIGRVRVKYLWQGANSTLSPWIRVLVPFTGGGGGMLMSPAEHDHVMVNYINGNIERPYVSGYLYTAECFPNKGATSADKRIDYKYTPRSITSQNGHTITFNDDEPASFLNFLVPPLAAAWNIASYIDDWCIESKIKGLKKKVDEAEKAYHDSQDDQDKKEAWEEAKYEYLMEKENTRNITTMEDIPSNPLNGGIVFKDANGMYEVKLSASDRNISIKSPLGDINMSAFTGISISAPNGDVSISGKNVSITAGNNLEIKGGANIQNKKPYYFGVASRMALAAVGAAVDPAISAGMGLISPHLQNIYEEAKNFTDLSFIRNMWEVLMRPVEGTLSIQSKRNILITAGLGKAWVPTSLISKTGTALEGGGKLWTLGLSTAHGEENNQDLDYLHNKGFLILSLLRYTKQEVKNYYYNFSRQAYHINKLTKKAYDALIFKLPGAYTQEFNDNIDLNKEYGALKAAWDNYKIGGLKKMLKSEFTDYWPRKTWIEKQAAEYIKAYEALRTAVEKFKETYVDNENALYESIERHWEGDAFEEKKFKAPDKPIVTPAEALGIELNSAEDLEKLIKKPVAISAGLTKKVMKACIYEVLRGFDDSKYFSIDDEAPSGSAIMDDSDAKWQEFVDAIVPYKMTEAEQEAASKDMMKNELINNLVAPLAAEFGIERNVTKNGQWWSVPGIQELVNWKGAAGPRTYCEYTSAGNILLSNNKGFTYKLDDDAAGFEAMRNPDLDAIKEYLRSLFKNTEPLVIT